MIIGIIAIITVQASRTIDSKTMDSQTTMDYHMSLGQALAHIKTPLKSRMEASREEHITITHIGIIGMEEEAIITAMRSSNQLSTKLILKKSIRHRQ